ncbi:MAG: hypothetical protein HY928_06120 [Elusimicrobia bacterium]|nr:hypothetical protein [Elusimicrobiota bacterium]
MNPAPGLLVVLSALAPARALPTDFPDAAALAGRQARFAPVDIGADISKLGAGDRAALKRLIEAARVMDGLFLRQTWDAAPQWLLRLAEDDSALGRARLRYFLTEKGPWDRQDHDSPFIPGAPAKPEQANFYPLDATKAEVEAWMNGLPDAQKAEAAGFFTVIRRLGDGKLRAVPNSLEYQNELQRAAALLKDAAASSEHPGLKSFLEKRAAAFLSDDYYDSDVAWMELDSPIEPTIGPYETYEDGWFGYKAAFEAFIGLRDDAETAKLQRFGGQLQWLEDNLPIDKSLRNPKLGAMSPIRVVNEVYASGDAAHGVTTAAFNLPNDEKVTAEKGAKRTMLKNVQRAKFDIVLTPLAKMALSPADQGRVDFSAFFTHILMHELMHGLGPHQSKDAQGRPVTVRQALKEASSALEEAKADASGLWALQKLVDKGVLDKKLEDTMYVTFLASAFRTLRFGVAEAHGKGMALQLNYLLDKGAFKVAGDGTFSVDTAKVKGAVEALSRDIMLAQAKGDYAAAKKWLDAMAVIRPEAKAVIDRAEGLPVDIEPRFTTVEELGL